MILPAKKCGYFATITPLSNVTIVTHRNTNTLEMNLFKRYTPFFGALLLAAGAPAYSETPTEEGEEEETLLVVVVDSLVQGFRAWNDPEEMYQRIKANFGTVFEEQAWPVKVKFARWSAGIPDDGLQLRIWFKSLEEETIGDLVFRAWINLREDGEKTADFGIIKVTTYPRLGRNMHDNLDEIITKAAEEVALKVNRAHFGQK